MRKDTPKEFMSFIKCRLELYPKFAFINPKSLQAVTNKVLFLEEYTYDNWLKCKIGKRNLKEPCPTISTRKDVKGCIQETFTYSSYRFVDYNFKRKVYIEGIEELIIK